MIVISLRTPRSTGKSFGAPGSTWEHLGVPMTSLRAPITILGALTSRLGARGITLKLSGKMTSSFAMLLVHLEIFATTYHSIIFKTHVFSFYSHRSIYIATHLRTVRLNSLQMVVESNWRCAGI